MNECISEEEIDKTKRKGLKPIWTLVSYPLSLSLSTLPISCFFFSAVERLGLA